MLYDYTYTSETICSSSCELLVCEPVMVQRCKRCSEYRKILNVMISRSKKDSDKSNPCSHTNYRYLNSPEKMQRLRRLHTTARSQRQKKQAIAVACSRCISLALSWHTTESNGRDLFFFSDPPHLLKTTRNCWANKRRQLWVGL